MNPRPSALFRRVLPLLTLALVASCSTKQREELSAHDHAADYGSVSQAAFSNGDFETGNLNGWTVTPYLNSSGLAAAPPTSRTQLNLSNGGSLLTYVRAGTAESQIPAGLTSGATLRYPKYGTNTAVVNELGANYNVNSLKQTMTVTNADVDPADGKVHVRFALAPVLENPGHGSTQQPYFWVQLFNVTRGTVLFQTFNYSNQTGVPWKTDPVNTGTVYTDWQSFDVAPGAAALAVGDQVELEAIAAGCSAGGHYGHVYVDGFGAFLPGLSVAASAPAQVNQGALLTYSFLAKNSGTSATSNTTVTFNLPAQTTFASLDASGASCTTPSVGAAGTVTCNLGTLNPAANVTFNVVVRVGPSATGKVSAGDYRIAATGVSALIGPLVESAITTTPLADLTITKSDGIAAAPWGAAVSYIIDVTNKGPTAVTGATISDPLPARLTGATWTCTASAGATCGAASGTGGISTTGNLPVNGLLRYVLNANIVSGTGDSSVTNQATVTVPSGVAEADSRDNTAVDTNAIGTLYPLTLTKGGVGRGTVISSPAAINCGPTCSGATAQFLSNTMVSLTASAKSGHTFTGWSGACSGTANPCNTTLSGAATLVANFSAPVYTIGTSVTGIGGTLSCPSSAPLGDDVACTLTPAGGYSLLQLIDNGVDVTASAAGGSYTITNISASHTLSAKFRNPAVATRFNLAGITTPRTAGVAATMSIEAIDQHGLRATAYAGSVRVASDDPQAALPANFAFSPSDGGVKSVQVTLKSAGTRAVSASDLGNGSISGTLGGITVTPAAAAQLAVGGLSSPRAAGTSGAITVEAQDAFGNRATGYTGTVRFLSGDTLATLPANYTFTASDAGVHSFQVTLKTSGPQEVQVTDTANTSIMGFQAGIEVVAGPATALYVTGFASPHTAGATGTITVDARDVYLNRATGYTGTIHFTSSDPQAVLPADFTFTASDAGARSFPVSLRTAGARSITATDGTLTGSQQGINVLPAAASQLVVTGLSSPRSAGAAGNITVEARDPFGNRATGYTGTVHFTSNDPQAALPTNNTFTSGDAGVKTLAVTLKSAGTRTVTATDLGNASISGTQSGLEVTPATASRLVVTGLSSPRSAGTAGNISVEARDAFDNRATGYTGTVHVTSSDAQAQLPADVAFTSADAGLKSLPVTLKTVGTQSVTVTDTGSSTIAGSLGGIVVSPAAAASFIVSGLVSPRTAGAGGSITVDARDAFNNRATGYTGTIHFSSNDAQAVLPTDFTFTSGDSGLHTFAVTLKTAGTRTITVTDTGSSSVTGTQSGIVVNPAAASRLVVSGLASPRTAGVAGNVTVEARDPYENRATGYTGTIRVTSNDTQAQLPANSTFTASDAGLKTLSVTLKTAGTRTVTVTDTGTSSITGSQSGIVVTPAAATHLVVSGLESQRTAGDLGILTIEVRDAFENRATGYTGTVRISTTDAQATHPETVTFISGDAGVLTVVVGLFTVGTHTVTITDTGSSSVTGTQSGIVVNPAAASRLVVSGLTSPRTAGVAGNITVEARDPYENRATGYTGTIHFTSDDTLAVLPADSTFTAGDAGLKTLSVTLKSVGTQRVTATDTVTSMIAGTQSGIVVTPATATHLVVSGLSSPRTAGVAGTITVEALDAFENRATGYTGTVHFTSNDSQAELPADVTFTSGDAGIKTLPVTLKTVGTRTVIATDAGTSSITGTQSGIVVTPADAARLVVSGLDSPRVAGDEGTLTIEALDGFGNRATGYTGIIHFASSDQQAELPADLAFDANDAGLLQVPVILKTVGEQTITVTDTVTGSITGSLSDLGVEPAPATVLVVAGLASPRIAGEEGTIAVEALDAFGNRATGYTGTVHFTSTDAQAALPTDFTFTASDAGLKSLQATLKTVGSQGITATDAVTASITGKQEGILVTPAAAATLVVTSTKASEQAGTALTVTVEALDAFGNRATGYTGTVAFTSTDAQADLPAEVTFEASDAGLKTFSITLKTAGDQTVTVTDSETSSITGDLAAVSVTPAPASELVVEFERDPLEAGVPTSVKVTARDPYGNVDTNFTGTVSFTSSDPNATLPESYTFTASDNGTHTFPNGVTLTGATDQTVTVSSPGVTTVGGETSVHVQPALGDHVKITGAASGTAGEPATFQLLVLDRFDNPVPAEHALTALLRDTTSALIEETTLTDATAGAPTVSGTTSTLGAATVTVRGTTAETLRLCAHGAALTGTEQCRTFTYTPAAADHVVLTSNVTDPIAGESVALTAQVYDAFGNKVAAEVSIALAVTGSGTLDGGSTVTITTDPATGEAHVAMRDERAESIQVQITGAAQDGADLPETKASEGLSFTIQPAAADHVALAIAPTGIAGEDVTVSVQIVDQFGNAHALATQVCVSVEGADGGAPALTAVTLGDAQSEEPAKVCGTTGADGSAQLTLKDTKAEEVTVSGTTTGLPGSGAADGEVKTTIQPAAPDRLRVVGQQQAIACGETELSIQLTDEFDNAVQDQHPTVTLHVSASRGTAQITATTLEELDAALPADTITGRIGENGAATLTATLDSDVELSVEWTSEELSGDDNASPTVVRFIPGAPTAAHSTVEAKGTQVEAGWGSVAIEITPIDDCGIRLGAGRTISARSSTGALSEMQDLGDGRYVTSFSTAEGTCAEEPATIEVEVEGVVIGTATIRSVCSDISPALSKVRVLANDLQACASKEVFTTLSVVPFGNTGLALPPGQDVRIVGEAPAIVWKATGSSTDEQTGATTYTFALGSNRCGSARAIPVRINGVPLATAPQVTFRCPEAQTVTAKIVGEASAPADGKTGVKVLVTAVDACGNPAFARPTTIQPTKVELHATALPAPTRTRDAVGTAEDGTAEFTVTSEQAGTTGLSVTVDHTTFAVAPTVSFTLPEVLDLAWTAASTKVAVGGEVTFTATLTSRYAGDLSQLALTPAFEGLTLVGVEGAEQKDGAIVLAKLAAKGTAEVKITAKATATGTAHATLTVAYGVEGVEQRHELTAAPLDLQVDQGVAATSGCNCSEGGSDQTALLALVALTILGLRTRRRSLAR